MSQKQLLAYLPATTEQAEQAIAAFEAINPTLFQNRGNLKHMLAEGWVEPYTVTLDGVPALVLFVSYSPDGGLWVHVAQALRTTNLLATFQAVEVIREFKGLKYIRFLTVRKGIVETALQLGYSIDGLILSKV